MFCWKLFYLLFAEMCRFSVCSFSLNLISLARLFIFHSACSIYYLTFHYLLPPFHYLLPSFHYLLPPFHYLLEKKLLTYYSFNTIHAFSYLYFLCFDVEGFAFDDSIMWVSGITLWLLLSMKGCKLVISHMQHIKKQ